MISQCIKHLQFKNIILYFTKQNYKNKFEESRGTQQTG